MITMAGISQNIEKYYDLVAPLGTRYIARIEDVPVHEYIVVQNSTGGGFSKFFVAEVDIDSQLVIGNFSGNASTLEFNRDKLFRYVEEE